MRLVGSSKSKQQFACNFLYAVLVAYSFIFYTLVSAAEYQDGFADTTRIKTVVGSDVYSFKRDAMWGLSKSGHNIRPNETLILDIGEYLQFDSVFFPSLTSSPCAAIVFFGISNNGGRLVESKVTYNDFVTASDTLPNDGHSKLVQSALTSDPFFEEHYLYNPRFSDNTISKEVIVATVLAQPYSRIEGAIDVRASFTVYKNSTATITITTTRACLKNGAWPIIDSAVRYLSESKE
ncbi:hypothetical protein [Aureimonas pseudogalii]|uniref:Uncharacterized protein n=1 Tax=Aureimonas pseudogalii TaxID=1744844 RepID=A0A7W6H7Z7_9HYPH|nr:hypothetical protein [Aureimonas pseudogalii]MBB4000309.1 hypothetical protein [Aureimonas pseudogalii]